MDITTNDDWEWVGDDYRVAFATTDDPRVVAVIERDEDDATFERCLDGDAILPVFTIDSDKASHAGGYEVDEDLANRIIEAEDRFRYAAGYRYNGLTSHMIAKGREMLARWAWIYHGTTLNRGHYGYNGQYEVLILNTPAYREHIGEDVSQDRETAQEWVDGMTSEVSAIADGDVFGVGYATHGGRVMDDGEPIDPTDVAWTMNIECWGFVGEEYAKKSAADFEYGEPILEPMIEEPDIFGAAKQVKEARL